MALINCPECEKQISDKASACPNCGYPINITQMASEAPSEEREKQSESAAQAEQKPGKRKTEWKVGLIVALIALLGIVIAVMSYAGIPGGMAGNYKLVSVTAKDSRNSVTRTAADMRTDYYLLLNSNGTGYIYGDTVEYTINWTDSSMTIRNLGVSFERSGRKITITVDYSPLDAQVIWVFERTSDSIPAPPLNR